jgi:hypothetical protein
MPVRRILMNSKMIALMLILIMIGCTGCGTNAGNQNHGSVAEEDSEIADVNEFSENTMFTLRVYEPWIYESLHYTLQTDGTLIVLYYNTELGREQLSDERMEEIRKVFSPEKVYSMNVGRENDRTDGTSRYIILYDSEENEISIGGYELEGGDHFNRYFDKLYALLEDDYTKQWSDKIDECISDGVTYGDRYLKEE